MEIGRGEECQISINHASVSRSHAEIKPIGDGRYELLDKGSANGIRVNGVDLQRALLDGRDNIELGDVVLKYVPKGEIYVPGPEGHELGDQDLGISRAPASQRPASELSGTAKLAILGAIVALVLVVSALALGGGSEDLELPAPRETSEQSQALAQAETLARKGNIEAAYEALGRVPTDSVLRRGGPYRQILAQWADHNFRAAEQTDAPKEKQRLLERVARNVEVDRVRRQRAGGLLKALGGSTVAIDDLPEALPPVLKPIWTPPTTQAANPSAAVANLPPTAAPARAAPKAAPAAPAPAPVDDAPTLVREDPFAEPGSPPEEPESE
jgi:pSer/pThr/pTyr-binding forkhead associated (FHA) protein